MSIQGNINQILSISGLLATQSPQIKSMAEKRQALRANKQALKTVEERFNLGRQGQLKAYQEGRHIVEAGFIGPVAQERADLLRERYKLDPSIKSWEAYKQATIEAGDITTAEKKLNERSAEGEAFLEDFREQRERMPIEERLQFEAEQATPSAIARETANQALDEQQTAIRETRNARNGFTSQRYGVQTRSGNKVRVDWRNR